MAHTRVFLHTPDAREPEVIDELVETITVREVITRHLEVTDGYVTLLEDTETEISDELTLAEAEIGHNAHLHVGKQAKVHVSVGYLGRSISEDLSAATTIR